MPEPTKLQSFAAHSSSGSEPGALTARTKTWLAKPSRSCAKKNPGPLTIIRQASEETGTITTLELTA